LSLLPGESKITDRLRDFLIFLVYFVIYKKLF
jgi:hypothetical protein